MAEAEPRRIDWESAVVDDGTLEVELTGSASKDWKQRFERVLALLGTPHSGWGEVRLAKGRVRVERLADGSEDELRHLLESAVIEANSTLQPDSAVDREATGAADEDPVAERDRRMTETFRGFASEQREPVR
jgi:hypothetical protein